LKDPRIDGTKILKQIGAELKFDFATLKNFPRFIDYISVAYKFFGRNLQPQNYKNLLMKNVTFMNPCIVI